MKINYNENENCYELLTWENGWKETGFSFETEEETIEFCDKKGYEIEE